MTKHKLKFLAGRLFKVLSPLFVLVGFLATMAGCGWLGAALGASHDALFWIAFIPVWVLLGIFFVGYCGMTVDDWITHELMTYKEPPEESKK